MLKVLGFLVVGCVALLLLGSLVGKPKDSAEERAGCVKAMMSDMGTGRKSYLDKQAYDAHVAAKCSNFEINGKPLGK